MNELGERIREVRKSQSMTQQDFSDKIGIKRNTLSLIESGAQGTSEPVIRAICREYGVSYEWLTDGIEPMYVPKDAVRLEKLSRIMSGDNEFLKSVLADIADMPEEFWAQVEEMVRRWVKEK